MVVETVLGLGYVLTIMIGPAVFRYVTDDTAAINALCAVLGVVPTYDMA